jgi:hypothetical protein
MGAILLTAIHSSRRLLFVQTRRQCIQDLSGHFMMRIMCHEFVLKVTLRPMELLESSCSYEKGILGRHLSCHCVSFVEENDKKSGYPPKDVLKGFLAVYVRDAQEEQTWFVIPVCYFNHPLFMTMVDFID